MATGGELWGGGLVAGTGHAVLGLGLLGWVVFKGVPGVTCSWGYPGWNYVKYNHALGRSRGAVFGVGWCDCIPWVCPVSLGGKVTRQELTFPPQ